MALGEGGRVVIASLLLNLQPTQLGIAVPCINTRGGEVWVTLSCWVLHAPSRSLTLPHAVLTLPHANANASGQVQQRDAPKVVGHSR